MRLYIILLLIHNNMAKISDVEKTEFCSKLSCDGDMDYVCGLRTEGNGFKLRMFRNECELLKYGCSVDNELAYGLINKEYCDQSFADFNETVHTEKTTQKLNNILFHTNATGICNEYNCSNEVSTRVCGITQDGRGFRIRHFDNKCELHKFNCENKVTYNETDRFICNELDSNNETEINDRIDFQNAPNLVVVNGNMLDKYGDINDTIDTFFAASHVFDLPMKEVQPLNTRRRILKYAGPIKVFVPWIVKPKNISNDTFHTPTLSSCYHKCPTKCPDTYAPVCGVPGIVAREPSIMFQNHCFMDVAQCKMFWEGKSATAHSSSYVEASFLFCMGDEMNAVYRFLPAIRTLQHMGRLKKKGKFKAKLRNFRFLSDFRSGRPKFMG